MQVSGVPVLCLVILLDAVDWSLVQRLTAYATQRSGFFID